MWKLLVFSILIFNSSALKTSAQEREWRDASYNKEWSVDVSQQLYRPGRGFLVDEKQQIYVSDIADNSIKMFDKNGDFVRAFGKKKGAGPGEVSHLIGFDVDNKGNVWIADPSNSRITIFQNDGSFVKHIPIEIIPYRIAVQPDGNSFLIINNTALQEGKFSIFSRNGEKLNHFGSDIIDNQMRNNIVLGGEITANPDGNYYYSPDFAGLLLGFDSKGKKIFRTKEIIPTPFPKVKFDARGGSWVDREANRISRGLFSDEKGRVGVFSYTFISKNAVKQAIDFYDQNTGEYTYSMKLPEAVFRVYSTNGILYTLRNTLTEIFLTAWKVSEKK
jgi:DNA-binding beta-propeller fold protein YncE